MPCSPCDWKRFRSSSHALYYGQAGYIGYVLQNGRPTSNNFMLIKSFEHERRYHAAPVLMRMHGRF